jgi:putative addiction module component (TIGR02574 family)
MPQTAPPLDVEQLSISQRLDLIELLWDSIPESLDALPVPDWHREELEKRLGAADAAPEEVVPWDEVKARLRSGS